MVQEISQVRGSEYLRLKWREERKKELWKAIPDVMDLIRFDDIFYLTFYNTEVELSLYRTSVLTHRSSHPSRGSRSVEERTPRRLGSPNTSRRINLVSVAQVPGRPSFLLHTFSVFMRVSFAEPDCHRLYCRRVQDIELWTGIRWLSLRLFSSDTKVPLPLWFNTTC